MVQTALPVAGYLKSRMEPISGESFSKLVIPIVDGESSNLLRHFSNSFEYISNAIGKGGVVLVHCAAGVSRSATVRAKALVSHL